MTSQDLQPERAVAVAAVHQACQLAMNVAADLRAAQVGPKHDDSPVTVADFAVQVLIARALRDALGDVPLVAEEDAELVRGNAQLRARILGHVHRFVPAMDEHELLALLDRGGHSGGSGRFWTLDPIDGTKGFVRAEQYALALALVVEGRIRIGVLGCPNLPLLAADPSSARGCIAVAVDGHGAWLRGLADPQERSIRVSGVQDPKAAAFCESVEAGHSSHGDAATVADRLGVTAAPVRMDSQCKYVAVARGDAEIYLRLPTRADYEEKLWDHAAGALLVREAGGEVSDVLGRPLDFALGRTLRANKGVIATNGKLHERVVAATRPLFEHMAPR